MKTNTRRIGAHVTTSSGLQNGIVKGKEIGANCLQIFSSSPQSWKRRQISQKDVIGFQTACVKENLHPVFVHAPYLVNLASADNRLVELSITTLHYELEFARRVGAVGVVVHLGSSRAGMEDIFSEVIKRIESILTRTPAGPVLLIENTAGCGGTFPKTLLECAQFARALPSERVGFCIDTQHAFASGYDFRTAETTDKFLSLLDANVGTRRVHLFHVNDSKVDLGSNKDRHENLGEGFIGLAGLRELFSRKEIEHIPIILETPGFDGNGPDRENIIRARRVTDGK